MTARLYPVLVAFGIDSLLIVALISVVAIMTPLPGVIARSRTPAGETGIVEITPRDAQATGSTAGSAPALTTADTDALTTSIPGLTLLSRVVSATTPVSSTSQHQQISVQAVDPGYRLIPGVSLAQGTFFTAQDAAAANRVAVLGPQAGGGLYPGPQSPIGQTIRIADVPFTVIGVLANPALAIMDTSSAVLIPFQSGQIRLFGTAPLSKILLQAADASRTQASIQDIQRVLSTRHHVRSGQSAAFTIVSWSSSATSTAGQTEQFTTRLLYLSRQYACRAKQLC